MQEQKRGHKILYIFTALTSISYLIWRIFFTIPIEFGRVAVVSGVILLVVEIIGMIESAVHFYNMTYLEIPVKPEVSDKAWPLVDVFIATYNEPVELLYKTINGCLNMEYPDPKRVHIYLCDDGMREEARELAHHMGIHYITREERTHAKAGNLNHAMSLTDSPLIVTFDADMIPMHDFLTTCVPYFLQKEKVGFIQLPQSFYNPDLFQYNLFSEGRIPNEQDYFYKDIQTAKNKTNSVIYGGSNTMLLRAALEEIGGFYTKVITEDFATGMLIESKGYRCYAINEVHASGLSPDDLESLIKQRARWARGCIQTSRKLNILFKRGLTLKQKLNYIISISYWYSGIKQLVYIVSPLLFSVFGIMVVKCNIIEALIFWLPMYLLNNRSLKILSNQIRTKKWTNIYETILFPALLPGVILETFCIAQKKFVVTKKDGSKGKSRYQLILAIPHGIGLILTSVGIINSVRLLFTTGSPNYLLVIFWLVGNLFTLMMSFFFIAGRQKNRKTERFRIEEPCQIRLKHKSLEGVSYDLSAGGISVLLDFPEYILEEDLEFIEIRTEHYQARFKANLIQVHKQEEKWKYAFVIEEIEEEAYRQLLHIIHDRVPPLPDKLQENSVYTDLCVNINKRNRKVMAFQRKLPRILLEQKIQVKDKEGRNYQVELINLNYAYMRLKGIEIKDLIVEMPQYEIKLKRDKVLEKNINQGTLYQVVHENEVAKNPYFLHDLKAWIIACETAKKAKEDIHKDYIKRQKNNKEFDEMSFLD